LKTQPRRTTNHMGNNYNNLTATWLHGYNSLTMTWLHGYNSLTATWLHGPDVYIWFSIETTSASYAAYDLIRY
jgi:hypothetical protein